MRYALTPTVKVGVRSWSPGEVDEYGDHIPTWSDPVEYLVYAVAPTDPAEIIGDPLTDLMVEPLTIYVPPGFPDVDRRDKVVYRGITYDVTGGVSWFIDGPFSFAPGGTLRVTRKDGEARG